MRLATFLLVLGVPALDVALDVFLVRRYGFLPVLVYLAVALVLGALALRWAGPITLVRATKRLGGGELPARELLDGLLMLAGGLYLAFPGPASDVLAAFLVVPGLRKLPRWWLSRSFRARHVRVEGAPRAGGPIDVDDYRVR